jgi:S-adenosylmethionine uptake transporter
MTHSGLPLGVAVLGIATFAGMDAVMKSLAINLGTYNAMLWRTLIALALAGAFLALRFKRWPARPVLRLHLWRGAITALMAFLFFWGLTRVPLAEAIGLSFIAPLIALYLAALLLGEKIDSRAVLASLLGLGGALVIIGGKLGSPYSDAVLLGMAAILLSALFYAYNLILQRQQALAAQPEEIAFFQNATVVAIYLLFAPFLAVPPPVDQVPGLVGAAVLSFTSLLLLAWAYRRAEARILIPVEYSAFIWAALLGWLFFDERLTLTTLAGTALIVIGCLAAARQQSGPAHRARATGGTD